jgi:putative Mg2+ transporter-C (MgtC) family protein
VSDLLSFAPEWLQLPVLGRLVLALVLGGALGLERELSAKPAGLRTLMLICVGAELLTEASLRAAGLVLHDFVRADPGRIAAQIVSGIGFLGAGTILVYRGSVVGLTTAATMWVAAAIGITIGLGSYVVAVGGTILVVLTLAVVGVIEDRLVEQRATNVLQVTLEGGERTPEEIEALLEELSFRMSRLDVKRAPDSTKFGYRIKGRKHAREELLERLTKDASVRSARIE